MVAVGSVQDGDGKFSFFYKYIFKRFTYFKKVLLNVILCLFVGGGRRGVR